MILPAKRKGRGGLKGLRGRHCQSPIVIRGFTVDGPYLVSNPSVVGARLVVILLKSNASKSLESCRGDVIRGASPNPRLNYPDVIGSTKYSRVVPCLEINSTCEYCSTGNRILNVV